MSRRSFLLMGFLLLSSCVTRPLEKPAAYDFSKIRSISVIPFSGPGGKEMTDKLIRQLVGTGIDINDALHKSDVILQGTVTDYKATLQMMVFLTDNSPVMPANTPTTADTVALTAQKQSMASMIAVAGLQATLTETSTKRLLWADAFTYEALDMSAATDVVASVLARSMSRTLPQLRQKVPA